MNAQVPLSALNRTVVRESGAIKEAFAADPVAGRLVGAAAAAFAIHHLVFRKGEWHLQAPNIVIAYLVSFPTLFVLELTSGARNILSSVYNTSISLGCFTVSILASMAIYRLFFHRLSSFPGPKGAAVSKLWHSAMCLNGKNYQVLEDLRKTYGDVVRTGKLPSRHIHITPPDYFTRSK
jgi:hypothetical protein